MELLTPSAPSVLPLTPPLGSPCSVQWLAVSILIYIGKALEFSGKWMELESIILSEVTQSQKNTHGIHTLISGYYPRSSEYPRYNSQVWIRQSFLESGTKYPWKELQRQSVEQRMKERPSRDCPIWESIPYTVTKPRRHLSLLQLDMPCLVDIPGRTYFF